MKKLWTTLLSVIAMMAAAAAQPYHSTAHTDAASIRGKIHDALTEMPLVDAEIELLNFSPRNAVLSDISGSFLVENVPHGRQRILVSKKGYRSLVVSDIVIVPGQTSEVEVLLEAELTETVLNPKKDSLLLKKQRVVSNAKDRPYNSMATISTRPFTVEEVTRFAGTRLDVARMATNYAGAFSYDDSRNDIVIRGNSPTHVLWQIEELPVENPNHITTTASTGGTDGAINVFALGKADFMTGPFAAQYGNAIGGVFDLQLRRGNTTRPQTMIQVGTQRAAVVIESPMGALNAPRRGSFLISLRASLGNYLFNKVSNRKIDIPADPENQDINLKFFIPIGKRDEIDIFAVGGRSRVFLPHDPAEFVDRVRYDFFEDEDYTHLSWFAMGGIKYTHFFNNKLYWRTVLGSTANLTFANWHYNTIDSLGNVLYRENSYTMDHRRINTVLNSYLNAKLNDRLLLRGGLTANLYTPHLYEYYTFYDQLQFDYYKPFVLLRGYAQGQYLLNKKWMFDWGLGAAWASLGNQWGLEPRVSVRFSPNDRHIITLGYGMQHQLPNFLNMFQLAAYSSNASPHPDPLRLNSRLKFLRSQQLALDYDWRVAQDWRLRVSVYGQYLDQIPSMVDSSTFTPLDGGADFYDINSLYGYTNNILGSKGKGYNAGAELCLEKYFSNGYYGLLSGTFFDSRHRASDGVWRNTIFNSRYMVNLLVGREFYLGKEKRTVLYADLRFSMMGGKPYTPVDTLASFLINDSYTQYDVSQTNAKFFKPSYWLHLKVGARFMGKKNRVSHTIRLDIFQLLELFGVQNPYAVHYSEAYKYPSDNPVMGTVRTSYQRGFIPDLTYMVQF